MTGYIEKGFEIDKGDLEKINSYTRSEFDEAMLYAFNVVLCNNDIDRDNEKFSVDTLYQLCELFKGKTGISDHSMKASCQKARIFDTWVERVDGRTTADNEAFYQLRAKAYMVRSEENLPLITEIEAGIKKEVSVSCSVAKSICSICGNDKKLKPCSHINGREYDGRKAFTILDDARDAYEFSFVAVPAQREAGVTKSFNTEKEIPMEDIIKTLKDCGSELTISKNQAREISSYIERLDEEAKLGKQYKQKLADEVVSLCAAAIPEMDMEVFSGVAQVMTTNELQSFKKAFTKAKAAKNVSLQLKPAGESPASNNQFRI